MDRISIEGLAQAGPASLGVPVLMVAIPCDVAFAGAMAQRSARG